MSECKGEVMTSSGDAKFRPFTRARELRCEGAACAGAIANWQREVGAKFGEQWIQWDKAEKVDPLTGRPPNKTRNGDYEPSWFKCSPARAGQLGGLFIRCTVTAIPCGGTPEKTVNEDKPDPDRKCSDYPSERIREAQKLLTCMREDRCANISADGQCGPITERCLKDFQRSSFGKRAGLRDDGLPHKETIEALRDFCRR